jgi:N-acetylglutamate synthase-like GNAT family acetyltransferase
VIFIGRFLADVLVLSVRRNPCRTKGGGAETSAERTVLTVPQVFALSEAIEPRYRALVLMATFTSLRWGELCALRPSDIDLEARIVRVERSLTELENGRLAFGPPNTERDWLRCRVLSFLGTAYFDEVMPAKASPSLGAELVAEDAGAIVGALDLSAEGQVATIDTIAVHPDHQRRGIGTSLLTQACSRAHALGSTTIEAWTRDDEPTLRWYRSRGFAESDHYLHVYADCYAQPGESADAVQGSPEFDVIKVFLHADLDHEAEMRTRFTRVHVCRRFSRPVTTA